MDVPISLLEWELFLSDQYKVKDFTGDAISASLLPSDYSVYSYEGGSFQAGVGVGSTSGAGFMNPATNALSLNGRDISQLVALAPGVALLPGQLGGYVVDPTGAVIPNARVEIQDTATRATWSASTTSDGYWLVLGLASGTYQITASAPAFKSTRMTVPYDASNPSAYRIMLNIGAVAETVTVESESSQVSIWNRKKVVPPPPPPQQASANVFNLQQRVAGVLPVAVDVPRTGTSYRFLRPLVVNEETKLSFTYKTK
jgi:hypothetical protein